MSGRFGAGPLRGIGSALLRAVAAASLLAVLDTLGVERAADDLVADTRQVLHTAAAHEHDRVLLQVVTDTGDVGGDLDLAREADARDLAESRVRLLRGGRVDAGAHTAALRGALERGGLGLGHLGRPALAAQLLDRRHYVSVSVRWFSDRPEPCPIWERPDHEGPAPMALSPAPPPQPGVSPDSAAPVRRS